MFNVSEKDIISIHPQVEGNSTINRDGMLHQLKLSLKLTVDIAQPDADPAPHWNAPLLPDYIETGLLLTTPVFKSVGIAGLEIKNALE